MWIQAIREGPAQNSLPSPSVTGPPNAGSKGPEEVQESSSQLQDSLDIFSMGIFLQFCVKTMAWDMGTEDLTSWSGQQLNSDQEFGHPWVSRLLEFYGKTEPGQNLSHHHKLPWDSTSCKAHPSRSLNTGNPLRQIPNKRR